MKCPKCGRVILEEDFICKHCGEPLRTPEKFYQENPPYRSRFYLLFHAYLGCIIGSHLKFLGYEDEAQNMRINNNPVKILEIFTSPIDWAIFMAKIMFIQFTVPVCVMFGMYRNDANGYPVRYFKPNTKSK